MFKEKFLVVDQKNIQNYLKNKDIQRQFQSNPQHFSDLITKQKN